MWRVYPRQCAGATGMRILLHKVGIRYLYPAYGKLKAREVADEAEYIGSIPIQEPAMKFQLMSRVVL